MPAWPGRRAPTPQALLPTAGPDAYLAYGYSLLGYNPKAYDVSA